MPSAEFSLLDDCRRAVRSNVVGRFKEQVDALTRQMDKSEDRKRLVSQPVFKEFLESNAPTLHKKILDSILSEHHGEKRPTCKRREQQLLYAASILQVLKGAIILVTTCIESHKA